MYLDILEVDISTQTTKVVASDILTIEFKEAILLQGPAGTTSHAELTDLDVGDPHTQYLLLAGRDGQEIDDDIVIKGSTSDNTSTTLTTRNADGDHTFSVKGDGSVQVGIEDPNAIAGALNSNARYARFSRIDDASRVFGVAMIFDRALGTIEVPEVLPKDYMVANWVFRASQGIPGAYSQIAGITGHIEEDYEAGTDEIRGYLVFGTTSAGYRTPTPKLTITSDGTIKLLYYSLPNSAGLPGQIMTPDGAGALVWAEVPAAAELKTTILTLTQDAPSGTSFFLNSSGTNYIKSGDDGDLRVNNDDFLNDSTIRFELNGTNLLKSEHIIRTSQYSFVFGFETSAQDWIKIIT